MADDRPEPPELIFATERNRSALSKAVSRGTLRRVGRGIYTRSRDDLGRIVHRNLWSILAHEVPGAVITDRCARRLGPDPSGVVTVVHRRARAVELPGLRIVPRLGPGPLVGDTPLPFGLWGASTERGMLDNLGGSGERYLADADLEAWIVDVAASHRGASRLNELRDRARLLAPALRRERAAARLDRLISAALTTGPAATTTTAALRAFADGAPYDRLRVERFEALAATLADLAPEPQPSLPADAARRALLPFYEAYFSNFIEGTEFPIDEAADIVFGARVPVHRPVDAHDILGSYRLVADEAEMRRVPDSGEELVEILLRRHSIMLEARPEARPGRFKERANQAGSTLFVDPALVESTLRAGSEAGRSLEDPFARAVFVMFLVAEVHPFTDGNGRLARIMMNAELVAGGQVRIIIPTVYRLNYLAALKGATHNGLFMSLVATLRFAQRYTARVDFTDRHSAERDLSATHAFRDPKEAEDAGVRLVLP